MKKVTLILIAIFLSGVTHAQFWYDPGEYKAGKIRVINRDDQVSSEESSFPIHHLRYREFTVDSVMTTSSFFGNHYAYLAPHIKNDKEASYYLKRAIPFETAQRCSMGAAFVWGLGVIIVPTDQRQFNNLMWVETGIVGCLFTSYFIKRYYANKAIRTWNKHLDMGLVRP